jgi:hypothetical protein
MPEEKGYSANVETSSTSPSRVDPIERSSEIIFGLIMGLTFTCTVSVASASRNDVMIMLGSALSCNIAWGIIDAAMFLLAGIVTRERRRTLALAIATAPDPRARQILLDNMPDGTNKVLIASDLDRLAAAIRAMPIPPRHVVPGGDDVRGAITIFLLVFLSTVPVALPFVFIGDVAHALRTSNAIAVLSLFLVGMGLGRHMNWPPYWVTGLAVALFGALLVAITIALGG